MGGDKAITGSHDKTAIIWDVATGEQLLVLKGHSDRIKAVAVFPAGDKVITGSGDNTAIIWDVQAGAIKKHFRKRGAADLFGWLPIVDILISFVQRASVIFVASVPWNRPVVAPN